MGKTPRWETGKVTTYAPIVMVSLTISDLAVALSPIAPDIPATTQQIRHWTREGLLVPIQDLHSGPGVHRRYASDAVLEAAVLSVFANTGFPISGSQVLAEAMTQLRLEIAKRKVGKGRKKPHIIIMRTALGQTAAAVLAEGEKFTGPRGFKVADAVMMIDLDLDKLFAQVTHERS
jgi:DNA-binding transcriptional MerR regulator